MITTRLLPLWVVVQALLFTVEGLQVTMTRTSGNEYCGRLRCWNDADDNGKILTTTGVTIYDVTDPKAEIRLVSFYPNGDGFFIDQTKINDINGTGNISRNHVDLTLDFRNQTDCLHGSFQCELTFVNINGQSDSLRETATLGDVSCSCETMMLELNKLSSRTDDVHRELTELRLNNTALEQELAYLKQNNNLLQINLNNLITQFSSLQSYLNFSHVGSTSTQPPTSVPVHTNCYRGMNHVNPREKILLWGSIPALCDTESDSGGWILIQRRTMGDMDFYRGWTDYKNGFGTIDTDYWIGNDLIHNLTSHGYTEMRIDMGLYGLKYYAQFSQFHVTDEATNYQLTISGYNGNAGDSMSAGGIGITTSYVHDGMMFSTYDMDHDHSGDNCAQKYTGGWWYNNCYHSNLNGVWARDDVGGIIWWNLNPYRSLTFVEMKVRHI